MNTAQLRQKILDLAIHGKLVDSGKLTVDSAVAEPTSAVIEPVETTRHVEQSETSIPKEKSHGLDFANAKSETQNAGKSLDFPNPCGNIPEEEQPFELPQGWKWCRLGDVCEFIGGGTPNKSNANYWNGDINWASVKDIKGEYLYATEDKITSEGVKNSSTNLAKDGDLILVTRISPGKAIISKIVTAINQDLKIVVPKIDIEKRFLYFVFQKAEKEIIENSSGTTVKGIKLDYLANLLIPLPPLAEQKQIVAKIEQIFSQIDILEQNKSALLLSVKQAKRKILDLAIHGKLVNEELGNRNEELARHCEKRSDEAISATSQEIPNQSADDNESPRVRNDIPPEEQPFELPQDWKWCRLGEIVETIPTKKYQILEKEIKTAGKYPVISQSGNYIEGYTNNESAVLRIDGNPLVVFGDHTRNVKYVDFDFVVGADGVKLLKPKDIFPKYLYYEILYSSIKIENRGYGRHFQFINKVLYPLPPLAVQKQIVAKIEQLFSALDKIQAAAE